MGKFNAIPERWTEYSDMGRQIPGTRFIAFKVPLKEELLQRHRLAGSFCPRTLRDHCQQLGLVVDLTNTNRYYHPSEFLSHNIEYAKLNIVGQKIPTTANMRRFIRLVDKFLEENKENDKIIGVHCTHGVNRAGYMICRYMIQKLGVAPDQAITDFNSARGHEQERLNYLEDLRHAAWIDDTYSPFGKDSTDVDTSKYAFQDYSGYEYMLSKKPSAMGPRHCGQYCSTVGTDCQWKKSTSSAQRSSGSGAKKVKKGPAKPVLPSGRGQKCSGTQGQFPSHGTPQKASTTPLMVKGTMKTTTEGTFPSVMTHTFTRSRRPVSARKDQNSGNQDTASSIQQTVDSPVSIEDLSITEVPHKTAGNP